MIVEKTYCFDCKRGTMTRIYEGETLCYDCGRKKVKLTKNWDKRSSQILGWTFIIGWIGFILFFLLWLFK